MNLVNIQSFQRNTFGDWLSLIAYCDTVEKLTSICCGCKNAPALFSHRLTKQKEQKVIGSDSYIPLCRKCYDKMTSSDQEALNI